MLKELLDKGGQGVKSGKGHCDWSKKSAAEVAARRDGIRIEFIRSGFGSRRQQAAESRTAELDPARSQSSNTNVTFRFTRYSTIFFLLTTTF